MLGVLVFTAIDPIKRFRQQETKFDFGRKLILALSFFGVGIYGGFVQAGVSFLVITALLVHGLDLVRINAIKVFVIFSYTFIALGVFIYHDLVDYTLGIALATGNAVGGIIGPRLAVAKGHDWIKWVVTLTVAVLALKLILAP